MRSSRIRGPGGAGWLALLGGGEFSFGETLNVDRRWLEEVAEGSVGFVPAASGSVDYGVHFVDYLAEVHDREAAVIPIYRARDARRGRNLERIASSSAVYLGGGVADHLLEALADSPAAEALARKPAEGGVLVAIAAAAQALGIWARGVRPGTFIPGLGWLPGGVVETNFDPGHDHRLRRLLARPGVSWGLGVAAGSAVLLGPDGAVEIVGSAFFAAGESGELEALK